MNQQIIDKTTSLIDSLSNQFTYKKFFLIFIAGFYLIGPLLIFENSTGFFKLNKIKKQTEILNTLSEIDKKSDLINKDHVKVISTEITAELKDYLQNKKLDNVVPVKLKKSYAAFLPWLIFILLQMPGKSEASDSTIFTISMLAILSAATSTIIPSFGLIFLSYFLYPILLFLFVNSIYLRSKDKIINVITKRFSGHAKGARR